MLGYAEDYYGTTDKANDPDGQKVEDYSKIIEELQSHRKEIEKLQLDMGGTSTVRNISSGLSISNQEYITQNEFFPFCPLEELQHQLDDIIDKDVSGKEDYFTADDFIHADQGFMLKEYFAYLLFFWFRLLPRFKYLVILSLVILSLCLVWTRYFSQHFWRHSFKYNDYNISFSFKSMRVCLGKASN